MVWNKGLTKETDNRIKDMSLKIATGQKKAWNELNIKERKDRLKLSPRTTVKSYSLISRKDYEYLLGVFLGDGTYLGKDGISICVGLQDSSFVDVIQQCIKDAFEYNASVCKMPSCFIINLCSQWILHNYFEGMKKDYFWFVPKLEFPEEFLAGCFDTDGCISLQKKRAEIIFAQKREPNVLLVSQLLQKLGFNRLGIHSYPRNGFPITILELSCFEMFKKFSEIIKIRHPRKKDILENIIRFYDFRYERRSFNYGT